MDDSASTHLSVVDGADALGDSVDGEKVLSS